MCQIYSLIFPCCSSINAMFPQRMGFTNLKWSWHYRYIFWFKMVFIHVHLVSSRSLPKSAVFTTDSDAKLYTSNAKYAWHTTTGPFVPKSIITWYPCFRSTTGIKFITGQIECTSDCSSMRWDIARTMSMHKNNTNDRAEIEKLTHRLESIRCQKQR